MSYNNNQAGGQAEPQNGAFIKAMIKITHPEWSAEQIEAEFQKKLYELNNPTHDNDGSCEYCSG